jgi:hypothetical protein
MPDTFSGCGKSPDFTRRQRVAREKGTIKRTSRMREKPWG